MSAPWTPSQTVGPFFRFGLDWLHDPQLVAPGTPGAITVSGRVTDGDGAAVPDALVELWQAGPDGAWPGPGDAFGGWARCLVDDVGGYRFTTLRPGSPGEGQAPHLWLSVFARGLLNRVVTRCYLPEDGDAHATDEVLAAVEPGRRPTLVATAEGGGTYRFDVRLQGDRETVFFAW